MTFSLHLGTQYLYTGLFTVCPAHKKVFLTNTFSPHFLQKPPNIQGCTKLDLFCFSWKTYLIARLFWQLSYLFHFLIHFREVTENNIVVLLAKVLQFVGMYHFQNIWVCVNICVNHIILNEYFLCCFWLHRLWIYFWHGIMWSIIFIWYLEKQGFTCLKIIQLFFQYISETEMLLLQLQTDAQYLLIV